MNDEKQDEPQEKQVVTGSGGIKLPQIGGGVPDEEPGDGERA